MTRLNLFILMAGLLSFFTSCKGQTKEENKDIEITSDKFKVGQIWKYSNRVGEDSSTLAVLKIEKYEKGDTIIHIRVNGVKIYSPQSTSGYSDFIGHLPFSEKALSKSVVKIVGQINDLPDFSDGYTRWKEAWDSGKGGYWTVDVKEAIEGVDKAIRPQK